MAQRAATVSEVQEIAPGLVASEGQITTALRVTAPLVAPRRFLALTSEAHAARAAHWLATTPGLGLGPGGGDLAEEAGPLTAEADGPSSRSFGAHAAEALSADDAMLATTPWGRQFLDYRRAVRGWGCFLASGGTF